MNKNSPRRLAREMAVRTLYTVDVGGQSPDETLDTSFESKELDEATQTFARTLVAVTMLQRDAIDARIDAVSDSFPVSRMNAVDRNILRLAVAEIKYGASDAPHATVINEAVELAKKYSTYESGRFVNGVLGALLEDRAVFSADLPSSDADVPPELAELSHTEAADA